MTPNTSRDRKPATLADHSPLKSKMLLQRGKLVQRFNGRNQQLRKIKNEGSFLRDCWSWVTQVRHRPFICQNQVRPKWLSNHLKKISMDQVWASEAQSNDTWKKQRENLPHTHTHTQIWSRNQTEIRKIDKTKNNSWLFENTNLINPKPD